MLIFTLISKLFLSGGKKISTVSLCSEKFMGIVLLCGLFGILYANYLQEPLLCNFGKTDIDPKIGNTVCYSRGNLTISKDYVPKHCTIYQKDFHNGSLELDVSNIQYLPAMVFLVSFIYLIPYFIFQSIQGEVMTELQKGNIVTNIKNLHSFGISKIYRSVFVHAAILLTFTIINFVLLDQLFDGQFAKFGWSYEGLRCTLFPLNNKCKVNIFINGENSEKTFTCALLVNNINGPVMTILWYALIGMLILVTLDTMIWIGFHFCPYETCLVIMKSFNMDLKRKMKVSALSMVMLPEERFFFLQILKNLSVNKRSDVVDDVYQSKFAQPQLGQQSA